MQFEIAKNLKPAGDQPQAIEKLEMIMAFKKELYAAIKSPSYEIEPSAVKTKLPKKKTFQEVQFIAHCSSLAATR